MTAGDRLRAFIAMHHELQTPRGRAFFWIGLGVLPVFWLPWMRRGDFSAVQILMARIWTVLFIVMTGIAWHLLPVFRNGILALPMSYSYVAFITGWVLIAWLMLRALSLFEIIFVVLSFGAPIASIIVPAMNQLEPSPASLLYILVPAVLHLWLSSHKSGCHAD